MVEEAYCSYEISKLLKEKGFDEECYSHYSSCGTCIRYGSTRKDEDIRRPTQQMAMRWLREEKNIYIEIRRSINTFQYGSIIMENARVVCRIENIHKTFEEAVEEAIKYCLENLSNINGI